MLPDLSFLRRLFVKSLIVDFHAGCISVLASSLTQLGDDVKVLSLTNHGWVIKKNGLRRTLQRPRSRQIELSRLGLTSENRLSRRFLRRVRARRNSLVLPGATSNSRPHEAVMVPTSITRGLALYDIAWIAFPPALYRRVLASGIAKHVVVYVSHRMDLWVQTAVNRAQFWDELRDDVETGRVSLVAANAFDAKYISHYIGFEPLVAAPATPYLTSQVPSRVKVDRPVLLGPPHLNLTSSFIIDLRNSIQSSLDAIPEVYKRFEFRDLVRHKAIVFIPYSIYSISIVELANLGVPLLMPSDEWLIASGALDDVRLAPIYETEEASREFEAQSSSDFPSPNSGDTSDRLHWLKFAFWKSLPNIHYWSSPEELDSLITKFNSTDSLRFTPRQSASTNFNDLGRYASPHQTPEG